MYQFIFYYNSEYNMIIVNVKSIKIISHISCIYYSYK